VGQNPDPFPFVIGAAVGRRKHSPFRIEPHRGQVSENSPESSRSEHWAVFSSRSEHWAVFHEDEPWSYLANDPRHFDPESASRTIKPCAVSRGADVLAGKSASHDINNSSPRASVERPNVIPNRERRHCSVVLSRDKDGLGVGIKLNGANASMPEQLTCENSSTMAREKMKLIQATSNSCCSINPIFLARR
jgi:hypothetical protein